MNETEALRQHLIKLLDWDDAHVDFDSVVDGIPARLRGRRPEGLPYSAWELLEHMRITQRDILDFCRYEVYDSPAWPDECWPKTPEPPSEKAWDDSVAAFRADRRTLTELITDPSIGLFAKIPHGTGQTYLREALLVADHSAYHLGEMVAVRRLLGAWK
ncbi:MAG: DinB family protein [Pyrinomonadaceae bacterium]